MVEPAGVDIGGFEVLLAGAWAFGGGLLFLRGDDKVDMVIPENWHLLHQALIDQMITRCFSAKSKVDYTLQYASIFTSCEVGLLDRN